MASIDLEKMRHKIKSTQWALVDFDWDSPGADRITPEQWPKLKAFMADLMWIEHVGARGFAALAKSAPTETLREIYTYFHAEEQRHANAEMALMKRWGMLEDDECPAPSPNLRLVINWLDRYADDTPFRMLATLIPMLEVALDGALCKFLLEIVEDPLCHAVFAKINDDESRHLGVGFTVMEIQGNSPRYIASMHMLASLLDPRLIAGAIIYFPLLNSMRDNLNELGLSEEKLYRAIDKFEKIGGRTQQGRNNPWYRVIAFHGSLVVDRNNFFYHRPVDLLVTISRMIPQRLLPKPPSWVGELTYQPIA